MTKHRNVEDSDLEKVTGGADDPIQDSNQTLVEADSPFEDGSDDTEVNLGDDMIVIDRQT